MFIQEYIKDYYPIEDKIKAKKTNPLKAIMESDSLPYDSIAVIDGTPQKVMFVTDDRVVPVMELLSWTAEDIEKVEKADPEYANAWKAYMDNVDVEDFDFESLHKILDDVSDIKQKKEEMLKKSCISL